MEETKSKPRDDYGRKEASFRCVHCGFPADKLLVQYSPGNIRLMKCENCKDVVDEYIECELTILLIDLILHKRKAYRHLLYNAQNHHAVDVKALLWKATFAFLVLDGFVVKHMVALYFHSGVVERFEEIFLTVLASSYFKAFLITMVVWEFPSSVLYIIEGFVISSNIVALKVLLQSTIARCIGMCISAHAAKLMVNHILRKSICHWIC